MKNAYTIICRAKTVTNGQSDIEGRKIPRWAPNDFLDPFRYSIIGIERIPRVRRTHFSRPKTAYFQTGQLVPYGIVAGR